MDGGQKKMYMRMVDIGLWMEDNVQCLVMLDELLKVGGGA